LCAGAKLQGWGTMRPVVAQPLGYGNMLLASYVENSAFPRPLRLK
jgi:hypothetical protein